MPDKIDIEHIKIVKTAFDKLMDKIVFVVGSTVTFYADLNERIESKVLFASPPAHIHIIEQMKGLMPEHTPQSITTVRRQLSSKIKYR